MNNNFQLEHIEDSWKDLAPWAKRKAQEGWEKFQQEGLPTKKHEAWAYTSLSSWEKTWQTQEREQTAVKKALEFLRPKDLALVFVDGAYSEQYSQNLQELNGAMSWSGLTEAKPILIPPAQAPHSLEHLAWALTHGGMALEIKGEVSSLIHLVHICTKRTAGAQNYIHVHRNAKASLLETYLAPELEAMNFAQTIVVLDEAAQLSHLLLQRGTNGLFSWKKTQAFLAKDSFYESAVLHLGGKLSRHELEIALKHSGAHASALGLYSLNGHEQSDHYTKILHQAPETFSFQLYKGILADHSHGVFQGTIHVQEHAKGSRAQQTNRNLLMSPTAQIHARPQLLIDNDDVKCSHGATIGQLDPEQSFYLESRGLSPQKARELLAQGFYLEVLGHLQSLLLRERALKALQGAGYA